MKYKFFVPVLGILLGLCESVLARDPYSGKVTGYGWNDLYGIKSNVAQVLSGRRTSVRFTTWIDEGGDGPTEPSEVNCGIQKGATGVVALVCVKNKNNVSTQVVNCKMPVNRELHPQISTSAIKPDPTIASPIAEFRYSINTSGPDVSAAFRATLTGLVGNPRIIFSQKGNPEKAFIRLMIDATSNDKDGIPKNYEVKRYFEKETGALQSVSIIINHDLIFSPGNSPDAINGSLEFAATNALLFAFGFHPVDADSMVGTINQAMCNQAALATVIPQ